MAPAKKGGANRAAPRDRRSSSRQSTPLSTLNGESAPPTPTTAIATPTSAAAQQATTSTIPKETAYIHTPTSTLISMDSTTTSIETMIAGTTAGKIDPPSAKELQTLHDRIRDTIGKTMAKRGEQCDRSMRQLAQKRKEAGKLAMEREWEEEKQRKAEGEKAKRKKGGKKRSAEEMLAEGLKGEEETEKEAKTGLPSVGAHGVARQDGVGVHEGAPPPPSPVIAPKTDSVDLMDTADSPSDSEASRAEAPSTAPLYERAFGKDPTKFDDPTIYNIRDLLDSMSEEEKREILNVAAWPSSDLHDLTAGDPPDMDFSNAKPANQVNFSTFQTYVEPYIRAFTEEDVAFLKERGDRITPYLIPQRGPRGYKEVWAAEDGMDGVAPPRRQEADPNEARGSMEEMNDDTAETDEVSLGPVMGRLLSIIRPTPSVRKDGSLNGGANNNSNEDADGDTTMVNGDISTAENTQQQDQAIAGATATEDHKPTTYLPPDAPRPPNLPTLDYETLEHRALQELRHIGFLAPQDVTDFPAQTDDEVCARLRTLQHELRRVSRQNNVRRARVLELTEERMAMQEYANIADDLDNQVNAAYLKRNRSLAKPGSHKKGSNSTVKPGQGPRGLAVAGGGGRSVSDGVRALMQKRRDWIEMVGPVVGFGRPPIPGEGETVFDDNSVRRLERGEREAEAGEGEGE